MKKIWLLIVLVIGLPVLADVTLTDKEYDDTIRRLEKDKEIINLNNLRWRKLKETPPTSSYVIKNNTTVIQTIEIPVHKSTPLKYELQFDIKIPEKSTDFLPFQLFLAGTLETAAVPDVKLGMQLFNISKLFPSFPIGLNFLVGVASTGGSLSYTLPEPFNNTMVHLYSGFAYEGKASYGVGISLNF